MPNSLNNGVIYTVGDPFIWLKVRFTQQIVRFIKFAE